MSLSNYDLESIFGCAVDLAEATAKYRSEDHSALLAAQSDPLGEASPDDQFRWHSALNKIEDASVRLRASLGANGPLTKEEVRSKFRHARGSAVRHALYRLTIAAVHLANYARRQVQEQDLMDRGTRLLRDGLAQLWEGMSAPERRAVRSLLTTSNETIDWPPNPSREPRPYKGPKEIAAEDAYFVISFERGANPTGKPGADSKTDNHQKNALAIPENADVLKLAKRLKDKRNKGRTIIDVARDFTVCDEKKAQSLARQLRRFPHLLE